MRIASSTSQNCGISYFIFDDIASLAGSADAQNVDPDILKEICKIAPISVFLVSRQEHVQKASLSFPGW
jgi:hypothetical protein